MYEELGDNQQESSRQEANPLPPIIREETQYDMFRTLEPREFEDFVDPDEVEDFRCYPCAKKRSLMLV